MQHADAPLPPPPLENAAWEAWLREAVRSCPAYQTSEENAALLEQCCAIAAKWRARFWDHPRSLWSRIRRGDRLVKELCECIPVLVRTRDTVAALPPDTKPITVLDLCSGFGYLSMFLSEVLAPYSSKVEKIVLVDVKWAPHNVAPGPTHLDPEHIFADGWPIRLTT